MNTNKLIGDGFKGNFMLVTLRMRLWSGRKADKQASSEATRAAGAVDGSARVIKDLFAGADSELKDVKAAFNAARSYVYQSTTPWASNTDGPMRGPRLLLTQNSLEFMKHYNMLAQEANRSITSLENVYAARVATALNNLAGLGHASEYPDVSEIRGLFDLQLDFDTVPDTTDFTTSNLPPQVAQFLVNKMEQRQNAAVNNAVADIRQRILSELARITEQMGKVAGGVKTRLHASLITNVESLLNLMQSMNVAEDPDVNALIDEMRDKLCSHDIEDIKNSVSLPAQLHTDAQDLAKALSEMELY